MFGSRNLSYIPKRKFTSRITNVYVTIPHALRYTAAVNNISIMNTKADMNAIDQIRHSLQTHVYDLYKRELPHLHAFTTELNVDPSKETFGDLSSNAALVLAFSH